MSSNVKLRRRLVPSMVALLAATGLAVTNASMIADSGSAPASGTAFSRAPSWGQGVEVKGQGHQRVPVNPPNAPPIPLGKPARDSVREAKSFIAENCYPVGQAGYESSCRNPGFAGDPHTHWADEPYYSTNRRYVWVVDELGPGREREWLQFTINAFNSVASGNRPYFLYATGEQIGWSGCQQSLRQVIAVCYQGGQRSATTSWYDPGSGHLLQSAVRIGTQARFVNDFYVEYSLAHEFGHAIGFAHDTDCASVMTYCTTADHQYLWYGTNQATVFASLYDGHAN